MTSLLLLFDVLIVAFAIFLIPYLPFLKVTSLFSRRCCISSFCWHLPKPLLTLYHSSSVFPASHAIKTCVNVLRHIITLLLSHHLICVRSVILQLYNPFNQYLIKANKPQYTQIIIWYLLCSFCEPLTQCFEYFYNVSHFFKLPFVLSKTRA